MPNCPAATYYGLTWFEAMACCVANHGVMAEVVSQEEQDFIKNMLVIGKYKVVHILVYNSVLSQ